jgi:hypothetical protein
MEPFSEVTSGLVHWERWDRVLQDRPMSRVGMMSICSSMEAMILEKGSLK